jgi:hypothetical protein
MLDILIYVAIGFISGIITGMGIGGGAVLIPALVILLGIDQVKAQGANLVYYIPTAVIALFIHVKNRQIETKIIWKIIITGVFGAIIGAVFADMLDGEWLRRGFGAFLLLIGLNELFFKHDKKDIQHHTQ